MKGNYNFRFCVVQSLDIHYIAAVLEVVRGKYTGIFSYASYTTLKSSVIDNDVFKLILRDVHISGYLTIGPMAVSVLNSLHSRQSLKGEVFPLFYFTNQQSHPSLCYSDIGIGFILMHIQCFSVRL